MTIEAIKSDHAWMALNTARGHLHDAVAHARKLGADLPATVDEALAEAEAALTAWRGTLADAEALETEPPPAT